MPAFEGGAAQPITVDTTGGKRQAGAAIPVYVASSGPQIAGPARRVVVVTSGPVEDRAALPVYEVASGGALIDGPAQPVYVVAGSLGEQIALLSGLVSYWKLDEASGTRMDAHTGGNDLTDNNTVTQNPGKIGSAAQFTAANSENLSRADNASLSMLNTSFTIAAWVYFDSLGANRGIVAKSELSTNRDYEVIYSLASSRFRFIVTSNGTTPTLIDATSFGALSTATWYFVVAWYDLVAKTINIRVNDGPIDSIAHTTGVNDGTATFYLGRFQGTLYMNGRIDEVGIWKRVLTAAERTALYNNGAGRTYPFVGT